MAILGNNLSSVRRENLAMVLGLVHRRGSVSRAALTIATGLNRSTVAALVAELVAGGFVIERSPDSTNSVGRPSPLVCPHPDLVVIAVNPEVDAITVGVVGLAGTVVARERHPVDHVLTPSEAVARIGAIVTGLATGRRVAAVGLAVPGLVRATDGVVRWAPHLHWTDEPIAALLGTATGLPVVAANDASLGAIAEQLFGAGRDTRDLVYLNGGASGIGGGVIAGGAPVGGVGGYAGEFGQNRPGILDPADQRAPGGTLEDEVSRARLLEVARLGAADEEQLSLALRDSTDPSVRAELARQARVLSVALSNAINVLNPQLVVLGGFLADVWASDPDALVALVARQSIAASFEGVRILPAELGGDRLLIGAAELAFATLLADPAGHQQAASPGSVRPPSALQSAVAE